MHDALEVIFQTEDLIAINKPHGLLVHPTKIAMDADTSVLQILRRQLDQKVYPVHRLDRKTSGVLLLALNKETQSIINALFSERKMDKSYTAIVRGYIPDEGEIDYAIKNDKGVIKNALTNYQLIKRYEIDEPLGKFNTSRYSEVRLFPKTGRYHQLRMHMAHIFHPIIGDRPHGCNKQNKMWKERFSMNTMMLHAHGLSFSLGGDKIYISANPSDEYMRVKEILMG